MKTFLIVAIAVILIFAVYLIIRVPSSPGSNPENNTDTTSTPTPPAVGVIRVEIKNFSFVPEAITIKKGETIEWINRDPVQHNAVSQGLFSSEVLNQDQIFSFKFENTGTYDYICTIHPSMKGKVTVVD